MKKLRLLVVASILLIRAPAFRAQGSSTLWQSESRFAASDFSNATRLYPVQYGWWQVIGEGITVPSGWGSMPLRYTLPVTPNRVYDVVFFSSSNDPASGNLDISWDEQATWDTSYRGMTGEVKVRENVFSDSAGTISFIIAHPSGLMSGLHYIKLIEKRDLSSWIADPYYSASELGLVTRLYPDELGWWQVLGESIYAPAGWSSMPLRYTLKVAPNTTYDVMFFTSNNDPDSGNLDISWDEQTTWDTSYRSVTGERIVKENVTSDGSGTISFVIAHPSGLISSLRYIRLVEGSSPGQPTAQDTLGWLTQHPDTLRLLWRPQGQSAWEGQTTGWTRQGTGLTGTVLGNRFSVTATGADFMDAVRLMVTATTQQATGSAYELMLTAPFDPTQWQRQFYPTMPHLVLQPGGNATVIFLNDPDDASQPSAGADVVNYPFGVLENDEGFLFWGGMDIGKFAALTPNTVSDTVPSLAYKPLSSLSVDDQVQFDLCMKWFPKPQFKYRDVVRWYVSSMENTDPVSMSLVQKWDGVARSRALPAGNIYSGLSGTSDQDKAAAGMSSVWYGNWGSIDGSYPTQGQWTNVNGGFTSTAEGMQAEWDRLGAIGSSVFVYFRQFLHYPPDYLYTDHAPYLSWVGKDKNGSPYFYPECWNIADFGNDDFRNWWVEQIKSCMDFYHVKGIAFDCGFPGQHEYMYSPARPESNYAHGMIAAQAEIWNWLLANHPEKRVITNETFGGLSQLYSDAVMLESPSSKGELDFEAAKALPTTVIAFDGVGLPASSYLKFLSQGACIGYQLPQLPGNWPEMHEFSAEAMETPLLVGSHDVEVVSGGDETTASAWAGNSRVLVAAHNGGTSQVIPTIQVSAAALQAAGIQTLPPQIAYILGPDGAVVSAQGTAGTFNSQDGLTIHPTLRAGDTILFMSYAGVKDIVPPSVVANFTAIGGVLDNTLTWTNPTDVDFTGTMIRYETTGYPTDPTDGTLLVDKMNSPGSNDTFVHTGLASGVLFYSAFAHDAVPNYSPTANASVARSDDYCYVDSFSYPNGNLNGGNGWTGSAGGEIAVVDQTVKISGGAGSYDAIKTISCSGSGGVIEVCVKVKSGTGASSMWRLCIDDPAGNNLGQWYGSGTTARGKIGTGSQVTGTQYLTGGWDDLQMKIYTATNTTEFFFNGTSIGTLNHGETGAGDVAGRLKFEHFNNASAAGSYLYFDELTVGGPTSSITGRLELQNFSGDITQLPIHVELRKHGGSVSSRTIYLDSLGGYRLTGVALGMYDVAFKASHWLQKVIGDVQVGT